VIADAIVAIPGKTPLTNLLAAIHSNRLGHVSRVLKAERRPLLDQLQSACLPVGNAPAAIGTAERIVLVFAAALSERGANLLLRKGAERVWTVSRTGAWTELDDIVLGTPIPSETHPDQLRLPQAEEPVAT
jgi:hypothetical protein